jgi:cyclin T
MTMLCVNVQDVHEVQKENMLLGKKLVLTTLDFDINIQHLYKPLVVAIRKFQVATNTCASCIKFCEWWVN